MLIHSIPRWYGSRKLSYAVHSVQDQESTSDCNRLTDNYSISYSAEKSHHDMVFLNLGAFPGHCCGLGLGRDRRSVPTTPCTKLKFDDLCKPLELFKLFAFVRMGAISLSHRVDRYIFTRPVIKAFSS